jgi:sugar lactone lactonase YvrE
MLVEEGRARIVADGLFFANEVRMSADETVLYAAETAAGRVIRYDVAADGSLTNRQPFGPDPLWEGALTDGVVVDAAGCVWVTEITRNALVRIAPDGTASLMLEDRAGEKVRVPTSLTFAGPDLRDALIGSLEMDRLPRFRCETPGLEPPHWRLG